MENPAGRRRLDQDAGMARVLGRVGVVVLVLTAIGLFAHYGFSVISWQ